MSRAEPLKLCPAAYRSTTWPLASSSSSTGSGAQYRPVVCLAGIESTWPFCTPAVQGIPAFTTSTSTCRQTNRSDVFGSSAPDSSPASHRTWNPLQIPSTNPPLRANRSTSTITGANRAIAPTRR